MSTDIGIFCFQVFSMIISNNNCFSTECRRTDSFLKSIISADKTKICHSFYDYVCERYADNYPLPLGQDIVNFSTLRIREIDNYLADAILSRGKTSIAIELAREYFKSCMDEKAIEGRGTIHIFDEVRNVGLNFVPPFGKRDSQNIDVSRILMDIKQYTTLSDFLIRISVKTSPKKKNGYILAIGNTPEINTFVSNGNENERIALRNYILRTVNYVYKDIHESIRPEWDPATVEARVDSVIDFLNEVAQTNDMDNKNAFTFSVSTFNDLQEKTDKIFKGKPIRFNWFTIVRELLGAGSVEHYQNGEEILVENEAQLMKVLQIISKTESFVFESAVWWAVVERLMSVSSKELRNYETEYQKAIGQYNPLPRKTYCGDELRKNFVFLAGYYLAQKKDSLRNKVKVTEMTEKLKLELIQLMNNIKWLSDNSKAKITKKLEDLTYHISFSDQMIDLNHIDQLYSEYDIDAGYFYENQKEATNRKKFGQFELLRTTLTNSQDSDTAQQDSDTTSQDSTADSQSSSSVLKLQLPPDNTFCAYMKAQNHIDVPIGSLGFPVFGLGLDSLNYGATGYAIAHELLHAVDVDHDRLKGLESVIEDWKTEEELKEYRARVKGLIDSYSAFYMEDIRKNVNGQKTFPENIADVFGFQLAIKVFRNEDKNQKKLGKFEFSPDQLFTIAFAMRHCEHSSVKYREKQNLLSIYPPASVRVDGVLQQSQEFADIWKCEPGTRMNPPNKCTLWT